MAKIRVHELAARIGRQNREVIEALKEKGVEVKSHMSSLDEASVAYINQKFLHSGKEQITKVDNSRTEEKMVTAKPEAEKAEAPKKKKNIIRVYHAQNASDGGKNRPKRQAQDKKPGARGPQAAKAPRNTETAPKKPAEAVKRQPETPAEKPTEQAKAPETAAPTTTAHTHNWVAVTTTVHHDAVTSQVWKEDSAAWDETVVTKAAWDEQRLVQDAYDENVMISDAYDEPVYGWAGICNACGYVFQPGDDVGVHMAAGCWSSWHDEWRPTGEVIHHDAVYQTVHHDAVYQTVHHDAETTVVHHDATGHYETVVTQAAWDETVVTGYTCSGCGATK